MNMREARTSTSTRIKLLRQRPHVGGRELHPGHLSRYGRRA